MTQIARMLTVTLATVSLLALGAGRSAAQAVYVSPPPVPYYAPPPPVTYYNPPVIYTRPPSVSYYYAPPVAYAPPLVTYYAPPAVSYTAAPAAVTTTYYGLFGRPRVSTTTYYPPGYVGVVK
jgi:hypothetical protein